MNPTDQRERTEAWLDDVLVSLPRSADFVSRAGDRINTDGASQYFDVEANQMKFETLDPDRMYDYAEEEALDLANYAWMLHQRAEFPGERSRAAAIAVGAFTTWLMISTTRDLAYSWRNGQRAQALVAVADLLPEEDCP